MSEDEGKKPFYRRLYDGWLAIAAHFGEAQTLVIIFLVYAFAVGPIAVAIQVGRGDLLAKRKLHEEGSAWREADSVASPDLERAKRLF